MLLRKSTRSSLTVLCSQRPRLDAVRGGTVHSGQRDPKRAKIRSKLGAMVNNLVHSMVTEISELVAENRTTEPRHMVHACRNAWSEVLLKAASA